MFPIPTTSTCPVCDRRVPAHIVQKGDDLFLDKVCPEHGPTSIFFWKDARLFEQSRRLERGDELPAEQVDIAQKEVRSFLTTFAIDVTTRCNMSCPTCVTDADRDSVPDPPRDTLLKWIPDVRGQRFRPNISLVGGESTMRDDLAELIRGIRSKGLEPRLNSNGLLLHDPAKIKELVQAGLKWVILQFDGLEPGPSIAFRGKDYSRYKLEVIEQLRRHGLFVHLAVMVQKGINDHEIGNILRFAMEEPCVRRVSFYPRSWIGRIQDPTTEPTHVADILAAMETTTRGEVTREDVMASKALGSTLFKLTGHPMFRPRICIYPFLLMRSGSRMLPTVRLLRPQALLQQTRASLRLLANVQKIFQYDEGSFSQDLLFVNIEKFYDRDAFDLRGALNCHHIYVTERGFFPFCIYNSYYRKRPNSTSPYTGCT